MEQEEECIHNVRLLGAQQEERRRKGEEEEDDGEAQVLCVVKNQLQHEPDVYPIPVFRSLHHRFLGSRSRQLQSSGAVSTMTLRRGLVPNADP